MTAVVSNSEVDAHRADLSLALHRVVDASIDVEDALREDEAAGQLWRKLDVWVSCATRVCALIEAIRRLP